MKTLKTPLQCASWNIPWIHNQVRQWAPVNCVDLCVVEMRADISIQQPYKPFSACHTQLLVVHLVVHDVVHLVVHLLAPSSWSTSCSLIGPIHLCSWQAGFLARRSWLVSRLNSILACYPPSTASCHGLGSLVGSQSLTISARESVWMFLDSHSICASSNYLYFT